MKHVLLIAAALSFQQVAGAVHRLPVKYVVQPQQKVDGAQSHNRFFKQTDPDIAFQRDSSVPLIDSKTGHLFVNITIGDPPKQYEVVLDTRSSLLWLPDVECSSSAGLSCEDTFHIADLQVRDQKFVGAGDIPAQLGFDGVLGLGYSDASNDEALSPLENMIAQGLLDEPLFSLYLASDDDGQSEVLRGGIDETKFSESLVNLPVTGKNSWEVIVDTVELGSGSFDSKSMSAILDSGTPFIVLPTEMAETINKQIYHVGCEKLGPLPDLTFKLAGRDFEISPRDYIDQDGDECKGGIVGIDFDWFDNAIILLGDVFLKRWYSVFDHGNASVSLARAK